MGLSVHTDEDGGGDTPLLGGIQLRVPFWNTFFIRPLFHRLQHLYSRVEAISTTWGPSTDAANGIGSTHLLAWAGRLAGSGRGGRLACGWHTALRRASALRRERVVVPTLSSAECVLHLGWRVSTR